MRLWFILVVLSLCSISPVDCLAQQATDRYALYTDFDNKVAGDPIDIRGAMFGEPYRLKNLDTKIVQLTPENNVLRVSNDLSSSYSRTLGWHLLGNAEIETGAVEISFDITPSALDNYNVYVRESTGAASSFLSLTLSSNGRLVASDKNGANLSIDDAYTAGETLSFKLSFDMTSRTSDIQLNGQSLNSGRAFGVTDRGIGTLLIGYGSSSNGSSFDLDNIQVVGDLPFLPVLQADFDDKTTSAPIDVGGAEANEPHSMSSHIDTVITETVPGNKLLDISSNDNSSARSLRWQFLNNLEIPSGLVVMDFDLTLQSRDFYRITVREPSGAAQSFMNLTFLPGGALSVSDLAQSTPHTLPGTTYNAGQMYEYRIIFDADSGNYDIFRDGAPIVRERNHGISAHGIGAIVNAFTHQTQTSAHMQLDNLQVLASDAAFIPAELEFLTETSSATVNQVLTPAITVGVINAMDDAVIDGTPVSLEIAPGTGPSGASLDGSNTTTVSGVASFSALSFDMPGTYRLQAYSLGKTRLGNVDVVVSPSDGIFADGFESAH